MASTDDTWLNQTRLEMAERIARITLWKLRDMRRRLHRPRTYRLPKEARTLKSLIAEAQAVGLIPPDAPAKPRPRGQRRSRQRH
jgi:hypothetical protein